jgi:hypothetical protein
VCLYNIVEYVMRPCWAGRASWGVDFCEVLYWRRSGAVPFGQGAWREAIVAGYRCGCDLSCMRGMENLLIWCGVSQLPGKREVLST